MAIDISLFDGNVAQLTLFGTTQVDPVDSSKTIRTFHFDAVPMVIGALGGSYIQGKKDNAFNAARGYDIPNKTLIQHVYPYSKKG